VCSSTKSRIELEPTLEPTSSVTLPRGEPRAAGLVCEGRLGLSCFSVTTEPREPGAGAARDVDKNNTDGVVGVGVSPQLLAEQILANQALLGSAFQSYALAFRADLAERARRGELPPEEHIRDVLLAFACLQGDSGAIAEFRRLFDPVMERVLGRRRATADESAEARQSVYERLLVGSLAAPPKLQDYRGKGPLKAWIATAVATTLMMDRRSAGRRNQRHEASALVDNGVINDPELEYIKVRYRTELEMAFGAALAALSDHHKALLRLHYVERLSAETIGRLYSKDRATSYRWLEAARAELLEETRRQLQTKLALGTTECDSLIRFARSNLDLSLTRRLS
jgi:RNA polymerase sigma-70 factor, ECF subfamily